jgi:hypothetical protein
MMGLFSRAKNHHGSRNVRPWVRGGGSGNIAFVKGDVILPGASVYAFKDTLKDPRYDITVLPAQNFASLGVTQPPMMYNGLALAPQPPQGYPYGGMGFTDLMAAKDYPDVPFQEPGTYFGGA